MTTEREILAERLREVADIEAVAGFVGWMVTVSYGEVDVIWFGESEQETVSRGLLHLADKLIQVRDHVALLLAPDIDPTKCQRLPAVDL